jgi:tripartite-type tricarboxylate transporter receptor subunit TctC
MKKSCIAFVGIVIFVCSLLMFALAPVAVQAAEPTAIRLIVPHSPGSAVDNYARLLSDQLAKVVGKPVVVENFPGAGGIRGAQELIKAPKDGFTIGMTNSNIAVYPSIIKDLPYDPVKDITQISIIGKDVFLFTINPKVAARNVKDLVALAKSKPGKLSYGSAGSGSIPHLVCELFCSEADVKITHVPYKGGSQLLADLLGGHIDMACLAVAQGGEQVRAGKLLALGVSAPKRHPAVPNVPTIVEAGIPGAIYEGWVALIGPPGLPQPIVKKWNDALLQVLKLKEVQESLAAQGTLIVGSTPEEAARVWKADIDKNAKLVKQSGLTFD